MTTQSWSTVWGISSDATFRTMASEFATKLAAVGLVKSTETGEIDLTTVTRPANGSFAGFQVWKFADSLAGSADIYMKIEYGCQTAGSGISRLIFAVTIGTGSNGSGTITGQTYARANVGSYASADTRADAVRTSRMCHAEGVFWFTYKELAFYGGSGSNNVGGGFLHVSRWTDDAAGCINRGFSVLNATEISYGNGSNIQAARLVAVRTVADTGIAVFTSTYNQSWSYLPWNLNGTTVNGDKQVGLVFTYTPRFIPTPFACLACKVDAALNTTFSATVVGTTAKTYITTDPINTGHFSEYGNSYLSLVWQ